MGNYLATDYLVAATWLTNMKQPLASAMSDGQKSGKRSFESESLSTLVLPTFRPVSSPHSPLG